MPVLSYIVLANETPGLQLSLDDGKACLFRRQTRQDNPLLHELSMSSLRNLDLKDMFVMMPMRILAKQK